MEVPVLGIIENMSGMICPHCGKKIEVFRKGGGKKAAEVLHVPYLGEIPMDPDMVKVGGEGRPYILSHAESFARKAIEQIVREIVGTLKKAKDA
jgi:ATP-binding protein involved in chromosome partitioning